MMIRPALPLARNGSRSRLRPAFTLVEVLVVMAILVIIAGAAVFGVQKAMDSARINEAKLKMQAVASAADRYYIAYQEHPTDPNQLVNMSPDGTAPVLQGGVAAITDPWGQQFQMELVTDQFSSQRIRVTSNGNGNGNRLQWPPN